MGKPKPKPAMNALLTQFGFKWGSCEVVRSFTYRGSVFIDIRTKRGVWSLKATPDGYVKFWKLPKQP